MRLPINALQIFIFGWSLICDFAFGKLDNIQIIQCRLAELRVFDIWQRLWLRLGVNVDDQLWLRLNPIPIPNCNHSTNPSPSRNTNTNPNPNPNRPTYL